MYKLEFIIVIAIAILSAIVCFKIRTAQVDKLIEQQHEILSALGN